MSEVRNLSPKSIWNHFEDLNAVPRPSKHEERVIAFMKDFGKELGLETIEDHVGNVIIKKPATQGFENRQTIIMQAHLDMVHQKNAETTFDFDTQGIQSYIDGDWVKAKGTTLGADNGMGVAAIMAVLSSTDIPHPAIEALFTIDEETGMTGAMGLTDEHLSGTILLNLDTEDDDELSVGCAGGVDTNTLLKYTEESISGDYTGYNIFVKGLKGGHSGMDINTGRANANKVMNRLLFNILSEFNSRIASINGGSLRNAIPRESFAHVVVPNDVSKKFEDHIRNTGAIIAQEYKITEPSMTIGIESVEASSKVIPTSVQDKITQSIAAVHNGVYQMSAAIEGLVETSSSLARVIVKDGEFITQSLQRSSVESAKWDIANAIGSVFHLIDAEVSHDGSYPGWTPNPDSAILKVTDELYTEMFNEKAQVKACHAGLECGILSEALPGVDMISFGPTIMHPHSPDEKVSILSVQKFWGYFLKVLERIPEA